MDLLDKANELFKDDRNNILLLRSSEHLFSPSFNSFFKKPVEFLRQLAF